MRAVVQRVTHASVSIDGEVVGKIARGLVVLLGVARGDTEAEARFLAEKTSFLRIFSDEAGKFNLSALDVGGEALVISQFTLLADTRKGRRPSFVEAAPPETAEPLVERFAGFLRELGLKVEAGRFGAHMLVDLANDGPVTIILDSKPERQGGTIGLRVEGGGLRRDPPPSTLNPPPSLANAERDGRGK